MPNVSKIRNRIEGPIEAVVGDEDSEEKFVIQVMYYPSAITPQLEEKIYGFGERQVAAAMEMVKSCVSSWDLEDDFEVTKMVSNPEFISVLEENKVHNPKKVKKGTGQFITRKVEINDEDLSQVPAEILFAVTKACSEAKTPPKRHPETSDSSFSPKG